MEHDLIEKLEQEGHYVELEDIDQGEIRTRLKDPHSFYYSREDEAYLYDPSLVEELKDIVILWIQRRVGQSK